MKFMLILLSLTLGIHFFTGCQQTKPVKKGTKYGTYDDEAVDKILKRQRR